jgi:pyruvate dehydrogenase E2 component (dihydrolipoamide acetyltransferase)
MGEFRMPSLGADMEKGILVGWNFKLGDPIKRGDIIAVVETDKGAIDIEVFEDGVIDEILVQPGEDAPVGTVLALIRTEKELPGAKVEAEAEAKLGKQEVVLTEKRTRVSPLARKLAGELGIDLSKVEGTGPGGAIECADVERAAKTKKIAEVEAKKTAEQVPDIPVKIKTQPQDLQSRMRRAIAAAMSRSNREIPHYYLETRIDMSCALKRLEIENQKRSIKERLLPVVLFIKATALALREVPQLNGYWIDDRLRFQEAVHIGLAISLRGGGLVIPAIHNSDLKSLDELMGTVRDLIIRTRSGHLRSSELTDATITLTNLGDMGVQTVFGVIYPPQVALVGFGKITEQPWAENGMLGIRPILNATLAADHRATDGHRGSQFLEALNRYLQEAEKL